MIRLRHRRGRRGQRLRDGRHDGSDRFPDDRGAAQTDSAGGAFDAFVTKLNATGSGLVYSTYLGGGGGLTRHGFGIAVDGAGSAYVTGDTGSTDFPTTAGAFQTTNAGGLFRRLCDEAGRDRLRAGLFDLPGRQRG